MYIDLSDLASLSDPNMQKRNATRALVKKGAERGYAHILSGASISPGVRKTRGTQPVRKAANPVSPFERTPEQGVGSTIGNKGAPNAASNTSGAPKATKPATSIESLLAAINLLVASFTSTRQTSSTEHMAAELRKARSDDDATSWNERRSAVHRQGFTFHAAKNEAVTVGLGKSAHTVRMSGNRLAPPPTVARKSTSSTRLSDTYWQRDRPKKPEVF